MNQGKSVLKSHSSKREPRPEKIRKTSKDEKETEKSKLLLASTLKESLKREKHRSESLSRPHNSLKSQESPRKSHSMDRNPSIRQKLTVTTGDKSTSRNIGKSSSESNKKTITSTKNTRHKTLNDQSSSSISQKSKSTSRAPKIIERKSSVQVAKSFVKNVQSKSTKLSKSSDKKSNSKKLSNADTTQNADQAYVLERPRTSTIRKGPSETVNTMSESDYSAKDTKPLKSSSSLSQSKTSLNGESDNDKASYEEDFEDYDSDFEESDTASISESNSSESSMDEQEDNMLDPQEENFVLQKSTFLLSSKLSSIPKAEIIPNKNSTENTFLKMSDRSSLYLKKNASDINDKKSVKSSRSFINFATAIEKTEEKNLEELNSASDIYEVESSVPLSKESSGITKGNYNIIYKPNLKQTFVQTENCEEEEVQTDTVDMSNKWTQNPTNGTSGYGGDEITTTRDKTVAWKSLFNVHSTKLTSFLQKSSNIILTLLDEEFSAFSNEYQMQRRPNFFYSDSYYVLSPLNFLLGIPIVSICCSEGSPYVITIHGNMVQLPSERGSLDEKGVICIWNISESKKPEYILTANSQPTCGTFGPGGSDIVVAGMVDGAVMLWDLTDLNTNNLQIELDVALTLRSPTYNSALILGSENHSSCVVGIQAVYK